MMKTSTKGIILGSVLSAGGAVLATTALRKKKNGQANESNANEASDQLMNELETELGDTPENTIKDKDTWEADKEESSDAPIAAEEEGLTQLDKAHKDDWVANGFPQTHQEMRELKEEAAEEREEKAK
ncbi:hypothetical protein RYX45_05220 [Alkalihalophilus pseudofirmus]|uniref:Uncharacterized protein n=2 Tax=Alkalihalophilus pseudofirmus TaxID=79885 RepID=A0AAJ2NKQ6_ALKPS|nr:hypothetical protein [Alkalihalophilus pseudofirmus]